MAADAVPLSEFEAPMARAVVTVLQRAGLPAGLVHGGAEDAVVVVPAERREEAFAVLARSMEDIQAEMSADVPRGTVARPAPATWERGAPHAPGEDEEPRPLVFERLRQLGFLAVLLVPLLVVTLAQVRIPGPYMAAIVIAGAVALTAWRNGRRDRS